MSNEHQTLTIENLRLLNAKLQQELQDLSARTFKSQKLELENEKLRCEIAELKRRSS